MASATAAGSSYATHGEPMIPIYIFYSMFGFQRTGDSIWAMADQLARGFLIGATAGRTTLTGEGLQHADGHSPLLAPPTRRSCTTTRRSRYEIVAHRAGRAAADVRLVRGAPARRGRHLLPDRLQRADRPAGRAGGPRRRGPAQGHLPLRRRARGPARRRATGAAAGQRCRLPVDPAGPADAGRATGAWPPTLWSVTSWNELARDAVAAEECNLLHPGRGAAHAVRHRQAARRGGPGRRRVSDYMRAVPLQIARWVPGDYRVLGTDGFGFADTRPAARRFFQRRRRVGRRPGAAGAGRRRRGRRRHGRQRPSRSTASTTPPPCAGVMQEGGDA